MEEDFDTAKQEKKSKYGKPKRRNFTKRSTNLAVFYIGKNPV